MASTATLKTIGNWDKQIGVPLADALGVSMDIMGRTGEEACRHALILMAQSARAMTKQAPKNRKVMRDQNGASYIEAFTKAGQPTRVYKWQFGDRAPENRRLDGTWDEALTIGNRGLGKRSWMWGLAKLGAKNTGGAIRGTSAVFSVTGAQANGYIKENRLSYILKAMPAGWEAAVVLRAGNKIMAQARAKMERAWQAAMRRREKRAIRTVRSFFRSVS